MSEPQRPANPPSRIIRKFLIDKGLILATPTGEWASFISFLPDDPDTAVAVYDTAGVQQGRIMRTGEKVEKPGIQIRFRSSDYPKAWGKARAVADALDVAGGSTVVLTNPNETVFIQNVSRTGNILTAGIEEEGDRKRHNLTVNAVITMRKVS